VTVASVFEALRVSPRTHSFKFLISPSLSTAPAPVRPLPPPSSFFACPFCHSEAPWRGARIWLVPVFRPLIHNFFLAHERFLIMTGFVDETTDQRTFVLGFFCDDGLPPRTNLFKTCFSTPSLLILGGKGQDQRSKPSKDQSNQRPKVRSRGPATRVTCHDNQDSLLLVPARAVACRA
jgi:hypothetical protein